MLNVCPKYMSCGAQFPFWTDDSHPTEVGVVHRISAYAVLRNDCKAETRSLDVMRCPDRNSYYYIYRYIGSYFNSCVGAFCGMD